MEDSTIQVQDEWVEDQLRIICNNTGKGNFKQKVEDLKKHVLPPSNSEGQEDKATQAQAHLRWFIQYLLTRRINLNQGMG